MQNVTIAVTSNVYIKTDFGKLKIIISTKEMLVINTPKRNKTELTHIAFLEQTSFQSILLLSLAPFKFRKKPFYSEGKKLFVQNSFFSLTVKNCIKTNSSCVPSFHTISVSLMQF